MSARTSSGPRLWPLSLDYPQSKWAMVGLGLAFAALLVSRRPDVLLHASLWAEDGAVWYPDAYNFGAASLAILRGGYLQVISRLVALLAQPLPLTWIPTAFAAAGLLLQVATAPFLCSSRLSQAWPNAWARLGFALIYIGLPGKGGYGGEVYGSVTHMQVHLAALAFLVVVADPPRNLLILAF